MKLTINLEDEEVIILKKRAKKNILDLKEQVEDIIRRSCINSKNNKIVQSKCDDRLVDIFSRYKRITKKKQKINK